MEPDEDEAHDEQQAPPAERQAVWLLIGPPYSGRTVHWKRRLRGSAPHRVSTLTPAGERSSLHAACRRLAAAVGGGESCCFDDVALQAAGARRAALAAAGGAGPGSPPLLAGLCVEPLGGEEQQVWAREWARADPDPALIGDTERSPAAGSAAVDEEAVTIGEGFDLLKRVSVPLQSPVPLRTAALILDADAALGPAVEQGAAPLRDGTAALLRSWYCMPLPRVAILASGSDAWGPAAAADLARSAAAASLPAPLYVYCPVKSPGAAPATQQQQQSGPRAAHSPERLGGLAKAGWRGCPLGIADVAYLQRAFGLDLDQVTLAGPRRGRMAQLARRLGLRWTDSGAAVAAAAQGADCGAILRRQQECVHDRRPPFLRAVEQPPATGADSRPLEWPLLRERAESADPGAVAELAAPRPLCPWPQARRGSALLLAAAPQHAADFARRLAAGGRTPPPPTEAAPAPAAPGPSPPRDARVCERAVSDFFGAPTVKRGSKFHRLGMVTLEGWAPGTGVARYSVASADKSTHYTVELRLDGEDPAGIAGAQCGCGRDTDPRSGHSLCRHAAAAAVSAAELGLALRDADTDDEQPPRPEVAPPAAPPAAACSPAAAGGGSPPAGAAGAAEGQPAEPVPLPPLDKLVLPEEERLKRMRGRVADSGGRLPWHMLGAAGGGGTRQRGAEPKTGGRRAQVKGPGAPKGCMTAYFHFVKENRAALRAEIPQAPVTAVAKLSGERWGALSAEEKEVYHQKARADRERYEREMAEYITTPEYRELAAAAARGEVAGQGRSPRRQRSPAGRAKGDSPQKQKVGTGWRIGDDGRWVHEWDDCSSATASDDGAAPAAPAAAAAADPQRAPKSSAASSATYDPDIGAEAPARRHCPAAAAAPQAKRARREAAGCEPALAAGPLQRLPHPAPLAAPAAARPPAPAPAPAAAPPGAGGAAAAAGDSGSEDQDALVDGLFFRRPARRTPEPPADSDPPPLAPLPLRADASPPRPPAPPAPPPPPAGEVAGAQSDSLDVDALFFRRGAPR